MHIRNLQNTDPFEGTQVEKVFVWKIFQVQDYQLTLMISIKIRIFYLTIINKLSKLVTLIFHCEQRKWNAKDHLYEIFVLS